MAPGGYTSNGEKASPGTSSAEPYEVGESYNAHKSRFHFSLAVDQEPSTFARTPAASNADFDPIPPSKRTWGTMAYFAYWMADGWAVSNWQVGELHYFCADKAARARNH
jgi:NCS1 family nucleobase:cation symporter-1